MKKKFLSICVIFGSTYAADAKFVGDLHLNPSGCEISGLCKIGEPFRYVDPDKVEWETAPPDTTDGASIPPWAQPFIGEPFRKEFVKAAIIHDHYCVRQVRSWRQTHKVFYNALIESGVDEGKAKLMYYAVYLGGPKWVDLMPPKPCPGTNHKNCEFAVRTNIPGLSSQPLSLPEGSIKMTRPAQYDDPAFASELKDAEKAISDSNGAITLDELAKRAEAKIPNDYYYNHGDTVEISTGVDR